MTQETRELTEELHAAVLELRKVGERLDRIEGRANRHRALSAVLALVVAAVAVLSVNEAQQRAREQREVCEQANATRADIRASIVETVLVIVERTEQPERLTPVVERIHDRLAETIPDRSC